MVEGKPQSDDPRRESTIGFRVPPELHQRIKEAAELEGLSLKKWMTLAAQARLRGHQRKISPDQVFRNEEELRLWMRIRRLLGPLRSARWALNELFKRDDEDD